MSRRRPNPSARNVSGIAARITALLVVVLSLPCHAGAVEPTVVVDGLASPTVIAVWSQPAGDRWLLIAEGDRGRVVAVPFDSLASDVSEQEPPLPFAEDLAPGPIRLAVAAETALIAAGDRLLAYDLSIDPPTQIADTKLPALPTGLSATEDYAFLLVDRTLQRSRQVAGRLTELRAVRPAGPPAAALAIGPRGHVVMIDKPIGQDTSTTWQLSFLSPVTPESPGSSIPIDGLTQPIALAYSADAPGRERLYALDTGEGAAGLYRLDAGFDANGRQSCNAERIATINRPTALVALGGGTILVATDDPTKDDPQRNGVVLRVVDPAIAQ